MQLLAFASAAERRCEEKGTARLKPLVGVWLHQGCGRPPPKQGKRQSPSVDVPTSLEEHYRAIYIYIYTGYIVVISVAICGYI